MRLWSRWLGYLGSGFERWGFFLEKAEHAKTVWRGGSLIVVAELLRSGDISTIRPMQRHRGESENEGRPGMTSVLGDLRRALREVLRVCLQLERSHIAYACGIRAALTLVVVLWIARSSGRMDIGVPMAIGVLMVNLSDVCEPHGFR